MDRPAPFFQKRNNTRVVVRNRSNFSRSPTRTTQLTSSVVSTEATKTSRKTVRRKISRNPTRTTEAAATTRIEKTTRAPTTTTTKKVITTTEIPSMIQQDYGKFSDEFSDDIASVLPALTSAQPRRPVRIESTTRALALAQQPNQLFELEPKEQRKQSSFDEILEQQYKIKGIDISSEERYEDEKLIGVLGSQVCNLKTFFFNETNYSFVNRSKLFSIHSAMIPQAFKLNVSTSAISRTQQIAQNTFSALVSVVNSMDTSLIVDQV